LLRDAKQVMIIPGYGMAVAQAQHIVYEITQALRRAKKVNVRFGIHPVAGRMPGHMNVLLAEAKVPYDIVFEMDEVNDDFPDVDVSIVIGANDIVNPSAGGSRGPDRRHAGARVLEGQNHHRAQAQHGHRLRRRAEPAVLSRQHTHAVRRRQGQPGRGVQGTVAWPRRIL
jgi:NAD/NADP transhydrogenase beta subunit